MSLSLQPAVTSSPLNGLPAQPVDGAASQPLSFEEVLKVEEKKMQQEINAQSAAALFATIQQPAISESIHGFDAGNPAESTKSVDQAALTVDTVQPAAAQPKTDKARAEARVQWSVVTTPRRSGRGADMRRNLPASGRQGFRVARPSGRKPA